MASASAQNGPEGQQGRDPHAQDWDAERYARTARFVAELGAPLLDMLDPQPHERILDLGCGDGHLTERLAGLCAEVHGVDASQQQVAAARERGLSADVADGHALAFEEEFHAVLSNAALHWMTEPDRVIDGVWRALRPNGRYVAEMGGYGNVATVAAALVAGLERRGHDGHAAVPWYFPTPEDKRARLEARGFQVLSMELIERPTPLPGEMADWLATFAGPFTKRLPEAEHADYVEEVVTALRPKLCDGDGRWTVDYVRLRFHARKPGAEPA